MSEKVDGTDVLWFIGITLVMVCMASSCLMKEYYEHQKDMLKLKAAAVQPERGEEGK